MAFDYMTRNANWQNASNEKEKYHLYLGSREWAEKRKVVLARAGNVCERCLRREASHIHHLTYIRKYNERADDLLALCVPCHEYNHGKQGNDPASLKCYLAGKVGGRKWNVAHSINSQCEWFASDGSNHSEHDFGGGFYTFGEYHDQVLESCVSVLEQCDMLVAYLDRNNSYGSIAEIAYASALDKPCLVCVKRSVNDDDEHPNVDGMFDAYWFVTSFPNVFVEEVQSEEQAAASIQKAITHVLKCWNQNARRRLA